MFKKFKDKLAEEVKSSPQRIHQFAQAAQAAVNSASSSISDITNNDLFSIGESEKSPRNTNSRLDGNLDTTQSESLQGPLTMARLEAANESYVESPRNRKLSNSSLASDVSFKLPSYDSPAMYHLQSDMDVSASEAEERGLASGVSLDHVTKEQLYSAYRRTQDRYSKYRARYADLARHYKVLERDNAKARSVLVETQDKALRRISELREQCSLEQSAKAHLESALRVELDEKNMKIESLNTKIKLLNGDIDGDIALPEEKKISQPENESQLIDLSSDESHQKDDALHSEISVLNNKIEKMEQLLNKYKDSVKSLKDKNSQLTTELQISNNNFESKVKENEELKIAADKFTLTLQELQKLKETNEELENTVNTNDFNKMKEIASLQNDLRQAQEEIVQLNTRIDVFNKREQEYAISLAENKLSIHKELESKEKEIKSLKLQCTAATKESDSYKIMLQDFKQNLSLVEEEKRKLMTEIFDLKSVKNSLSDVENELKSHKLKCETLETSQAKLKEEFKCLELQYKQEIAEKMAMFDRNNYLENRNKQLSDENIEKSKIITKLEKDIEEFSKTDPNINTLSMSDDNKNLLEEVNAWKNKYCILENEIQDERVELIKLQSEIEKLLRNHEMVQSDNIELHEIVTKLKTENTLLQHIKKELHKMLNCIVKLKSDINNLKSENQTLLDENKNNISNVNKAILSLNTNLMEILNDINNTKTASNNEEITLLNSNLLSLKTENNNLKLATDMSKEHCNKLEAEIKLLKDDKNKLKLFIDEKLKEQESYKSLPEENNSLKNKLNIMSNDIEAMKHNCSKLEEENKILKDMKNKINITLNEKNAVLETVNRLTTENESLKNKIDTTLKEIQCYKDKFSDAENNNVCLKEEISSLNDKYKELTVEKDTLNVLNKKIEEKCSEYECSIKEMKKEAQARETVQKQLDQKLIDHQNIENKYNTLVKLNEDLKNNYEQLLKINEQVKLENSELLENVSKYRKQQEQGEKTIQNLQRDMKSIFDKNILLEEQITKLNNDFEEVTNIFNDTEKLNNNLKEENTVLLHKCEQLKQEKESLHEKVLESEQKLTDYENSASTDVDPSKELNKNANEDANIEMKQYLALSADKNQLLSEIEDLQSHLQKVCKDNTVLNDQLREVLANKVEIHSSSEMDKLNTILLEEKQKNNELLRENSVLVEKNLELEDCIKSHYTNHVATNENSNFTDITLNEKENTDLNEKLKKVMEMNMLLESKVAELELLSRTDDNSVQQMQIINEKLKKSNEKLERRLDEALVSLRHFQALEESTELEYLRNILYEYLTGSGTHSETLAKVIAAVVKFDPRQTQLVLQKEKERQGLLKQLGLM